MVRHTAVAVMAGGGALCLLVAVIVRSQTPTDPSGRLELLLGAEDGAPGGIPSPAQLGERPEGSIGSMPLQGPPSL